MRIDIDREQVANLQYSLKKEYLLTNGRGGYASSTILDCHTRKYHGLLVVPVEHHGKTFCLLSKLEASVIIDKKEFNLSTNKFPGVYSPTGHQYVEKIVLDGFPETTYKIGDTIIEKSIIMPRNEDTVLVKYAVVSSEHTVVLKLIPLINYRDYHTVAGENMFIRPRTYFEKNGFKFSPYDAMPSLYIQTSETSTFYPSPTWWKAFEYLKERNRGYPYQEDLFSPGVFELKLDKGESVVIRASTSALVGRISTGSFSETKRMAALTARFAAEKEPLKTLKASGEDYLITGADKTAGVIAGYHWFGEWGRDTLISLAGLTLCRGENETALSILRKYARFQKDGLLPNVVDGKGNHAYNSIDSVFWFFRAVQQYLEFSNDRKGVEKHLFEPLCNILRAYFDAIVPGASIGKDGFIYAGDCTTQLTWMDATVHGTPVTPRHGAAIEINALWFNALSFIIDTFEKKLDNGLLKKCAAARDAFAAGFETAFWNQDENYLIDVYRGPQDRDCSIRPNQLFAVGLPFTCVDRGTALKVIQKVKEQLVTPFGLRTLSPSDVRYSPEYRGDQTMRDRTYHQGMVWPWLLGILCDALLKVQPKAEVRKYFMETFAPLWTTHLYEYGAFHLSEIFTPNPPHVAKGAMAQAWSCAETIRALESLK